jgi:hypothetical protein
MAPLTLLTACGGDTPDDARAPSGEVLEGTISDAMLPVDRVRSQPPLAAPERTAGGEDGTATDDADADEATAAAEGDTAAAEVVAPATELTPAPAN